MTEPEAEVLHIAAPPLHAFAGCLSRSHGNHTGMTTRTEHIKPNLVVYDMSSMRFTRTPGGPITMRAGSGEILSTVANPPEELRSAALAAMDAASETARVWRGGSICQVALYNPYTQEISVGPSERCQVYTCAGALELTAEGLSGHLEGESICFSGGFRAHLCGADSLMQDIRPRILAHRH
jgi:hypothetical protein